MELCVGIAALLGMGCSHAAAGQRGNAFQLSSTPHLSMVRKGVPGWPLSAPLLTALLHDSEGICGELELWGREKSSRVVPKGAEGAAGAERGD